jgi:hypothetical protein
MGQHDLLLQAQRFVKRRCDMNRITRMLTITGLGLFAGITIGAGPAMAATNSGQSTAKASTTATAAKPGDRVEGYYDSRTQCEIAARIRGYDSDEYDCVRVGGGFDHGDWALVLNYDNWDGGHNWHGGHDWHGGHNWHGGFPFHNGGHHDGPHHNGPHHNGPHHMN